MRYNSKIRENIGASGLVIHFTAFPNHSNSNWTAFTWHPTSSSALSITSLLLWVAFINCLVKSALSLKPSGIVVYLDNILYQIQNQNVFIEYIQDITGNYGQTKKRNSELQFNYSALVESIRLLSNL